MAGGWQDWEWDETLFAGARAVLRAGAPPVQEGLAEVLRTELALDNHGRLLDVGCGPGVVTLRLAHLFDEVVGLDADHDMLIEAEQLAEDAGVVNAQWVQMRAEDLPGALRRFRVVAFEASFHWLHRPTVPRVVRTMLDPEGVAVQIDAPAYRCDALADAAVSEPPHPFPQTTRSPNSAAVTSGLTPAPGAAFATRRQWRERRLRRRRLCAGA